MVGNKLKKNLRTAALLGFVPLVLAAGTALTGATSTGAGDIDRPAVAGDIDWPVPGGDAVAGDIDWPVPGGDVLAGDIDWPVPAV